MSDHQDWNHVVFTNTKSVSNKPKQIAIQNRVQDIDQSKVASQRKLENETENFHIQYISSALSREIQLVRIQKKMTQKDVAQKLYVQLSRIQELESGKAICDAETKKLIKQLEKLFSATFVTQKN